MVNTLSIVFAMHQWQYTLKLIQYQISDSWSNAKTTYRMAIVSCRGFLSFFVMFGLWITVKLHYKALQRQLSQCCTILLTHIMLFVRTMRDCAEICRLCDQMRLLINCPGSQPSHNIRGHGLLCQKQLQLESFKTKETERRITDFRS